MLMQQVKVQVRQYLTRRDENPVPMRTMVGYISKQTEKAVFVHLHGRPEPSSHCLHCHRTLTHPVSLLYGVGPICGGHMHINPLKSEAELEARYEEIKEKMEAVRWSGWLPKSKITVEETGEYEIVEAKKWQIKFLYQGKVYNVTTESETKKEEIKAKAEKIQITPVA